MRKPIYNDSLSDLDGPIEATIKQFQDRKEYLESLGYTNIRVEFETEYGYYDDSWVSCNYYGTKVEKTKKGGRNE